MMRESVAASLHTRATVMGSASRLTREVGYAHSGWRRGSHTYSCTSVDPVSGLRYTTHTLRRSMTVSPIKQGEGVR